MCAFNFFFVQVKTEEIHTCPVCNSEKISETIHLATQMHITKDLFTFHQCGKCESIYLSSRVVSEELHKFYPDYYLPYRGADAWGKFGSFVERDQRKIDKKRKKVCLSFHNSLSATSLLDVGCGKPSFLKQLAEHTSWNLTGIDFSDFGWQEDKDQYRKMTLVKGDVQEMHWKESFDIVTMWHYLEHDYWPQKTIKKLSQYLKPKGKIIIEVPDPYSITAKHQQQFWEGWHVPRHAVLYSEEGLRQLLEDQGFRVISYKRHGTLDPFILWWMGTMEKRELDWSGTMEQEFVPLVWKKMYTFPLFLWEKQLPLGIQTIIGELRP